MAGQVYVDHQKADKPGDTFSEEAEIEVRGKGLQYVSRGGLKLEKAMKEFGLTLAEKTCMDIGASTGGFTDCMLQNGARKVYSVDVGYGQLAWSLRTDPRVVNLERTNARYLTREQIPEVIDFFSVDVSFISLTIILPAVRPLLGEQGQAVCLIKPQFEAGREKVGKRVLSVTNRFIEKSSKKSETLSWITDILFWDSPFLQSRVRKEISNISSIWNDLTPPCAWKQFQALNGW